MNLSNMKDETLIVYYENIRHQIERETGSRYRFAGESVKNYADKLREEMERRRLRFKPIDWPPRSLPFWKRLVFGLL
jgi:hypothetical protein